MKTSKAIQTILMHHKDEIFDLINNRTSVAELQVVVNKCLDEAEATGNTSVPEARAYFASAAKRGYNNYTSTLMTYMTGIAVGR